MAQRFVEEASAQLAPVYDQQVQALQSQVPAIQQLYQSLMQGLEAQGKTQTQGILESSASRGLTRSSIPVDLQTTLAQTLMGERSKLGAQQAQDIAGINMKVGDLGIQRAQAIQGLADTLYNRDMKEREFQMQQQAQERDYQLKLQQIAAEAKSGGTLANPVQPFIDSFATWMKGNKSMATRQQQDAFVNSLFNQYGIKDTGARQVVWDAINAQFKRVSDPTKDWTWKR